ncbi:hypothetical protein B0A50_00820 [Salinomyces thailandicus]|uniref:NIMA interactive protein n=1 Tax=Salinomyces thailandicus TaxID=706561 RepID=A0A4U0UDC0_9PEZI|nr:hypothetical protein B0A50_00820 [Salinomyces thailandica]
MDHDTLRTASNYLNNILLARGLLRNSEPIDFVKPSKDTRAQIINLVHDLILHQDRDKDSREHVAITLRNLRADDTRKNNEIERLKAKNEELARATTQAQAAQRAAETEAKKVERNIKSLQDQAAKLKTSLAQVKTLCANDVRKRDLELNRLKAHLQGQQRGNKIVAPSISVTGGGIRKLERDEQQSRDLEDPAYSLRQETTEFLTQLSQSLSDENDQLIALIRNVVGSLRDLLGLQVYGYRAPDSAVGSMGSNVSGHKAAPAVGAPNSYEVLAADMEDCLAHLKPILSNPNFVTVEEVEVREEEIARLRQGWEHMEQRWRDVLAMMEGWRIRMGTGETINLDDLTRGLGLVSPVRPLHVRGAETEEREEPEPSMLGHDDGVSEIQLPTADDEDDEDAAEAGGMQEQQDTPPAPPRHSPSLRGTKFTTAARMNQTLPSARTTPPKRKRDVLDPPEFFDLRPTGHNSAPASPQLPEATELDINLDEQEDGSDLDASAPEPGARMTVDEKLQLAQREAEEAAAAVRQPSPRKSKSQSAALEPASSRLPWEIDSVGDEDDKENDDTLGKMPPSAVKRTKIRGRPKRRKSTLNPEELEELLMMGGE